MKEVLMRRGGVSMYVENNNVDQMKRGGFEVVQEKEEVKEEKKTYAGLKKPDLVELAEALGVDSDGKVDELKASIDALELSEDDLQGYIDALE